MKYNPAAINMPSHRADWMAASDMQELSARKRGMIRTAPVNESTRIARRYGDKLILAEDNGSLVLIEVPQKGAAITRWVYTSINI